VPVRQEITFDASASQDPDGTIVEYHWDFGDGGEGTGVVVTHTYAEVGKVTVRLTVRDNRGATATAERELTVEEINTPPPPPPSPGR